MKARLLIVGLVGLCLGAGPVMADMQIRMDSLQADLTVSPVNAAQATGAVVLGVGGELNLDLEAGPPWSDRDNAQMYKGVGDVDFIQLSLAFNRVAADVWNATGNLWINDTVGKRVDADFVSTAITITPYGSSGDWQFNMTGDLFVKSPPAILVNGTSGGAWTFLGEGTKAWAPDADLVLNQITVVGWENWGTGQLMEIHVQVGTGSLDTLLTPGSATTYEDGQLNVTITPVPAAVLLGLLGLGAAGLKLRRFA